MENYFTTEEINTQKSLIKKGYFIFDIKEKKLLNEIRDKTLFHVKDWFKKRKIKLKINTNILNNIHKFISIENLNSSFLRKMLKITKQYQLYKSMRCLSGSFQIDAIFDRGVVYEV